MMLIPVPLAELLKQFSELIDKKLLEKQQQEIQGKLLTRKEIAAKFGVSLVTLNEWVKRGFIECHRIGGRVYFRPEHIEEALKKIKRYSHTKAHDVRA